MVRDRLVENLFPTVICREFGLQRHMWRNENAKNILRRLEMGYLWLRVHYPMANPIKEPFWQQLVQFLRVSVKMDRKFRPPMASVPISPASVISTSVVSIEKSHSVATIMSNEALIKPYMTLFLHE
jgi:hypothetical protein